MSGGLAGDEPSMNERACCRLLGLALGGGGGSPARAVSTVTEARAVGRKIGGGRPPSLGSEAMYLARLC